MNTNGSTSYSMPTDNSSPKTHQRQPGEEPESRPLTRIKIRREDYLNPRVDPKSVEGLEWFYKLAFYSYPNPLSLIPPSERFRKLGLFQAWEYFFKQHEILWKVWETMRDGGWDLITFNSVVDDFLESIHPSVDPILPHPSTTSWPSLGVALVNFCLRQGVTVETTQALDTLLSHSDVDPLLPCSMLQPPFKAMYIPFGELIQMDNPCGFRHDGAFCMERRFDVGREITLVLPGRDDRGRHPSCTITLAICNESRPIVEMLAEAESNLVSYNTENGVPDSGSDSEYPFESTIIAERVMYLAKLFLYMGLPEARKVVRNEWTDAKKRLAGLGPKKQAKLSRKLEDLYDRLEVGPERLSEFTGGHGHGEGYEVSPHWRRGHFRHQPCGPRNQERKLIFVQPMLVRADRLKGETAR